jgi:hypothetical protein
MSRCSAPMSPAGSAGVGQEGWVRSSAWICDFSSTHSTIACADDSGHNPTTSRTLASSSRSLENLKARSARVDVVLGPHPPDRAVGWFPAGRPAADVTSGHPKRLGPILWTLMPSG